MKYFEYGRFIAMFIRFIIYLAVFAFILNDLLLHLLS